MTTDTSKENVERLAKTADLFAKAMEVWQHKTKKHNEDVRDTLRALSAENDALRKQIAESQESALTEMQRLGQEYDAAPTPAQVRREALEEAARMAEAQWERWTDISGVECDVTACENIAAAIRALADKEQG